MPAESKSQKKTEKEACVRRLMTLIKVAMTKQADRYGDDPPVPELLLRSPIGGLVAPAAATMETIDAARHFLDIYREYRASPWPVKSPTRPSSASPASFRSRPPVTPLTPATPWTQYDAARFNADARYLSSVGRGLMAPVAATVETVNAAWPKSSTQTSSASPASLRPLTPVTPVTPADEPTTRGWGDWIRENPWTAAGIGIGAPLAAYGAYRAFRPKKKTEKETEKEAAQLLMTKVAAVSALHRFGHNQSPYIRYAIKHAALKFLAGQTLPQAIKSAFPHCSALQCFQFAVNVAKQANMGCMPMATTGPQSFMGSPSAAFASSVNPRF